MKTMSYRYLVLYEPLRIIKEYETHYIVLDDIRVDKEPNEIITTITYFYPETIVQYKNELGKIVSIDIDEPEVPYVIDLGDEIVWASKDEVKEINY